MTRKVTENKIVIASHNPGKIIEIDKLLRRFKIQTISAQHLGLPEPIENGKTFRENAEIKARETAEASKVLSLSDDSGLVIPILDGAPGIYSARWARDSNSKNQNFGRAITKIRQAIIAKNAQPEGQVATFICALSLCWPDGTIETVEGAVHGKLTFPPKGKRGFGYDPIFIPIQYKLTFGEMAPQDKHKISHRAIAFNTLIKNCLTN
jgi:XTP/dITP diphosphohydrolase